jgi:hypothetical protein
MAKSRRGSAEQPARKRDRRLIARPSVWLATLSTVVGIATGMFTLRDQIIPNESGTASASLGAYQGAVGGICDDLNEAERTRAKDARALLHELPKQRTTLRQRNLLLEGVNRSVAAGVDQSSRLRGLAVPEELAGRHATTLAAWTRNLDRIREYAQRLDGVRTRNDLSAAVRYLSRIRPALSRDGATLRAGLVRLGSSACRLEPAIVTRTVTLPPVHKPKPKPKPEQASPDTTPPPAPAPTSTPEPAPPASGSGASIDAPEAVNPPPVVGGGGGGD